MKKSIKKALSLVLVLSCLFSLFAMTASAKYDIVMFGNRCGTQIVRNVTNKTVRCYFSSYYNQWIYVELLGRNGNVVWHCWVSPDDHSSFWCGSNVYSIRLSSAGVTRVDLYY